MTNSPKDQPPRVFRKIRIDTTYEYEPILGEVLGWWRKVDAARLGHDIEVHLNHELHEYDRLFINGKQVEIPQQNEHRPRSRQ